jgi:DNA-binding GntR family transcriptional regulator
MRASRAEHRKILAAILSGDAEAAAEAFEQHILTGKQRMLNTIGGESAQSQQVTEEDSVHV